MMRSAKICIIFFIVFCLLEINGFTKSNPIDFIKYNKTFSTIFLKRNNTKEKFNAWEINIDNKIKQGKHAEALKECKNIESEAIKLHSEYWLCVSYYYYGLCAKNLKDYKTALQYLLKIIHYKNPSFEKERLFNLFRLTGDVYSRLNTYSEAIQYYNKCLELKDNLSEKKLLIYPYVNLGTIYSKQHNYISARKYYLEGLDLIKDTDEYIASIIYNNLGNDEYSQGNYSKAIEFYMKGIQLEEKNNDLEGLAFSYNNLGSIYTQELKDLSKAVLYYTKSMDIEKKRGNDDGIATELNNIGNVLTLQQKFFDAEKTFENALHIFKKNNNTEGIAKTFEYLGALHSKTGDYNKSISAFTKCIDLRKKDNDELKLANVYNSVGAIYYYQKDYNKALLHYFKCLEISKLKKDKSTMKRVYCGIHEAYAASEQYDKAYQYLQYYSDLKDTLLNENISKQIIDIQEKYEKSKMEQKVAMQNLEIKNKSLQRNGVLVFLILSIIVFSGALYMIFQKRKNEKLLYEKNTKIKDQEIKNLVQHSEIKSMVSMAEGQEQERQRISRELHDRIGSLLSLIKLNLSNAEGGNKQVIKENLALLDNTYQEVRNISHNLHSGLLTHFGLKAALNDLKKTVETHGVIRFNLLFHEKELTLPKETESVIFKVLQELVTNALKHAEAKNLDIQINDAEDGIISITIEDDGKGFDTSSLKNKEGIGLKNVRYRIESIGGSLDISSSPGKGSCFILNIPAPEMAVKKVLS